MGKRGEKFDSKETVPEKRCKLYENDEVVPNSQPDESFEKDSEHKCFFDQEHLAPAEKKPRPKSSKVATVCDKELKRMTFYIDDNSGKLFGGNNKADFVLTILFETFIRLGIWNNFVI